jgi:hypothetical protein
MGNWREEETGETFRSLIWHILNFSLFIVIDSAELSCSLSLSLSLAASLLAFLVSFYTFTVSLVVPPRLCEDESLSLFDPEEIDSGWANVMLFCLCLAISCLFCLAS